MSVAEAIITRSSVQRSPFLARSMKFHEAGLLFIREVAFARQQTRGKRLLPASRPSTIRQHPVKRIAPCFARGFGVVHLRPRENSRGV